MDVIDDILTAQNEEKGTVLVLLDFYRAFDSIHSYLSNRSQFLRDRGVLRGSVIGSLLFVVCTADIVKYITYLVEISYIRR